MVDVYWIARGAKVFALAVALGGGVSLAHAAPPAEAPSESESEKPKARGKTKKSKGLTLDANQRAYLRQVEAIDVPEFNVQRSDFASNLREICGETRTLPWNRWQGSLPVAATDRNVVLPELVKRFRSFSDRDGDRAREVLRAIGAKLADIAAVCQHIHAPASLGQGDLAYLRALREDEARALARTVQALDKAKRELSALARASSDDVRALGSAQDALDVAAGGTLQSMASLGTLGPVSDKVLEGLGEFLIDRAREEAIAHLREHVVDRVCSGNAGVFLRHLCQALDEMDPRLALSAAGDALHAAVSFDLERLPDLLLSYAAWGRSDKAYVNAIFRVSLPLMRQAHVKRNPEGYLAGFHAIEPVDCERANGPTATLAGCADAFALLRVGSALAYAFAQEAGSANRVIADEYLVVAALLAWELRLDALPPGPQTRARQLLGVTGELPLVRVRKMIVEGRGAAREAAEILTTLRELTRNPRLSPSAADFLQLATRSVSALAGASAMAACGGVNPQTTDNAEAKALCLPSSHFLAGMREAPAIARQVRAVAERDWGRSTAALLRFVEGQLEGNVEAQAQLTPLRGVLPLVVEIANAKSSSDVASALDAAFPARGYKRKFQQGVVALNGFVGVYGGGAFSSAGQRRLEGALFAPVGMHISGPVGRNRKRPSALGAFLAVVDLGAVTTGKFFRDDRERDDSDPAAVEENEIAEPSQFNLANLFSPGAYFTATLAGSPFTVGAGASYSPFVLRETTITTDTTSAQPEVLDERAQSVGALRAGVFVAIDLTFLAFGL